MRAIVTYFLVWWQEHAAAIAEGKPAPALSESSDIRPLNLEDFKFAHEQVKTHSLLQDPWKLQHPI